MSGSRENQVKWGLRNKKRKEGSNNKWHCAVCSVPTNAISPTIKKQLSLNWTNDIFDFPLKIILTL